MESGSISLFIGGLSGDTTEQSIVLAMDSLGCSVLEVSLPLLLKSGRSKGFAFVKVRNELDANLILQSGLTIKGRRVDCQIAVNPENKQEYQESLTRRKIFIGNLPSTIQQKRIQVELSSLGQLRQSYFLTSKNGLSLYCLAEFFEPSVAQLLVKSGLNIDGLLLPVSFYRPKHLRSQKLSPSASINVSNGPISEPEYLLGYTLSLKETILLRQKLQSENDASHRANYRFAVRASADKLVSYKKVSLSSGIVYVSAAKQAVCKTTIPIQEEEEDVSIQHSEGVQQAENKALVRSYANLGSQPSTLGRDGRQRPFHYI